MNNYLFQTRIVVLHGGQSGSSEKYFNRESIRQSNSPPYLKLLGDARLSNIFGVWYGQYLINCIDI